MKITIQFTKEEIVEKLLQFALDVSTDLDRCDYSRQITKRALKFAHILIEQKTLTITPQFFKNIFNEFGVELFGPTDLIGELHNYGFTIVITDSNKKQWTIDSGDLSY